MSMIVTDTMKSRDARRASRFAVDIDMERNDDKITVKRMNFNLRAGYAAPGDAQSLNEQFIYILEEIRKNLQDDLSLTDGDYKDFMGQLREIGAQAYSSLPEGMGNYIQSLENDAGEKGISLDFTFPDGWDLLWEMIYTGRAIGPVEPERFWGFRYPIGHLYWETDLPNVIRLQDGIFASAHDELTSSRAELERLAESLKELKTRHNRDLSIVRVDDALHGDPLEGDMLLAYFNEEKFGFGIVHFACHCENTERHASQARLLFSVRRNELSICLGTVLANSQYGFQRKPLVFLNACDSSTPLHFLQSLNFPSGLVRFGAGGVIATACTIPDEFASAYAAEFYRRLLQKPFTDIPAFIGETMLETSRHFLYERKNPLGLAYGLYAISNQQLELD